MVTSSYDNANSIEQTRQQAAIVNPIHTEVTAQPIKTPLEVQLGLTLLPARYILRAFAKGANDGASPNWLHHASGATLVRDFIADRTRFGEGLFQRLEKRLAEFEPHAKVLFDAKPVSREQIIDALHSYEVNGEKVGRQLLEDVKQLHKSWDAANISDNTIKHYFESGRNGITERSKGRIKSAMSEAVFEVMYDVLLGIGGIAYTSRVQKNVHKDILSIYTEAVAYEAGKDPREVTNQDINNSRNQIIQSTVKNYDFKRNWRYGISALPFLKLVPSPAIRAQQWGEYAVGAWGALWATDIWGRQPTMMESFRSFINEKLNPLYGIGDPVKTREILDLYQQYTYRFSRDTAFTSLSMNDADANVMWANSEGLFNRIKDLMNDTYNYKHTTELDPETNTPKTYANFTLPKFIYLLGNGLINARQPEWSMAFVEIANKEGMEAVKEAEKIFRNNGEVREVVDKYQIDLNPTQHVNGVSGITLSPIATPDQKNNENNATPIGTPSNENRKTSDAMPTRSDNDNQPDELISDDREPETKIDSASTRHQAAALQENGKNTVALSA